MRYTAMPNAVKGEGIWAASGVNEAQCWNDGNRDDHIQSTCAWSGSAGYISAADRRTRKKLQVESGKRILYISCFLTSHSAREGVQRRLGSLLETIRYL